MSELYRHLERASDGVQRKVIGIDADVVTWEPVLKDHHEHFSACRADWFHRMCGVLIGEVTL